MYGEVTKRELGEGTKRKKDGTAKLCTGMGFWRLWHMQRGVVDNVYTSSRPLMQSPPLIGRGDAYVCGGGVKQVSLEQEEVEVERVDGWYSTLRQHLVLKGLEQRGFANSKRKGVEGGGRWWVEGVADECYADGRGAQSTGSPALHRPTLQGRMTLCSTYLPENR